MKRPQMPVPSRRGLVVGAWAVGLLTMALIFWMLWLLFNLQDSAETSNADRDRLASDVAEQGTLLAEQQAQLDKANERLVEAGKRPVNVPPSLVEGVPGQPGPAGDVGPAGPRGFPGVDGKDGRDGIDGRDGKSIVGPRGMPGKDGRDGADSTVPGPPGADGKDGESIVGPQGPRGEKGEQGDPGPPQSCESEFVCAGEMQGALTNYFTKGDVVALLRALGCSVSTDAGNPNQTFTCTITGKP